MAAPSPIVVAVTRQLAKYPNLDPRAVLAVASQEGLGGAIGDNGTSFGPWQLHQGGAYPASAPQDPQQAQQWAESPAGLDYALGQQARVAGGLKGDAAIEALVSRFERPANVPREIAGAEHAYGGISAPASLARAAVGGSGGSVGPLTAGPPETPAPNFRPQLAAELAAAAGSQGNNLQAFYGTLAQALRARAAASQPVSEAPTLTGGHTAPVPLHGAAAAPGLVRGNTQGEQAAFLQDLERLAGFEHSPVDINSGYRSLAEQQQLWDNRASNPNPVAAPGHSLHEHGLAADGTVNGVPLGKLPAAILKRFGLAAVPGDPVHVQVAR